MMNEPKIEMTKKERDCLLAIYREISASGFPLRLVDVSRLMGVRPPTALELVDRLRRKGMVERRRGLITLSKDGMDVARGLVAVHRALEVFFSGCGLSADEACRLVSQFDYMVGPAMAPRILSALGNPSTCPHGYPIPDLR
ncbi:MAG: metal-dependent transcriptional regulator [Conexivisphaera sp.]